MFCRSRGFLWRRWATYGYCARCLLMKAGWLGGWEGFWFSSLALSPVTGRGLSFCEMCFFFLAGRELVYIVWESGRCIIHFMFDSHIRDTNLSGFVDCTLLLQYLQLFKGGGLLFTELVYCLMIG
ncbi:hypothetical protein CCHR01_04080 [Colletotrichum chrysophilum]|uniref:Uncharacterized protein n=1 Tax=Colletotrichum chrysophilum TaxID=1836956 RepID=A0AAD9EIU2_9PEZI|nr:hypothetical protein CCHR01_04080 [Colletotrichum chrysophilum]